MRIKKQEFDAEEVSLDGNVFEDCQFSKSRMVFLGRQPVSFTGCRFLDVQWDFREAAGLTASFLRVLSDETGDYGKGLIVNSFPSLKEWLRPEILEKLTQPVQSRG
jgi:hypothetical protein